MKNLIFIPVILLMIILVGCLTFETAEIRIIFNENSRTEGTIEVTYKNIKSGEALLKDQVDDFNELISYYQDDGFLLDQLSDGIYIKERDLKEENGKLIGKYSGIFRNLKFDNEPLKTVNDEFIMLMDEEDEVIETNGKIIKSEKNTFISWSKDQKELYWKLKMKREAHTTSLLEMFREWKEKQ